LRQAKLTLHNGIRHKVVIYRLEKPFQAEPLPSRDQHPPFSFEGGTFLLGDQIHLVHHLNRGLLHCLEFSQHLFYLGLLLIVHGAFVAIVHRRVLVRWAGAAAVSIVLATPIVAIAYRQRHQIAFLARRDYVTATHVLTSQWFGWTAVAVMAWALILVAVITQTVAPLRRQEGTDDRGSLVLLATLWLVIPTASILTCLRAAPNAAPSCRAGCTSRCRPKSKTWC